MLSARGAAAWFAKVALSARTRGALAGRGAEAAESSHLSPRVLRPRLLCSRLGIVR
jgi:hypothetical protein